jgi:hypothetical protein
LVRVRRVAERVQVKAMGRYIPMKEATKVAHADVFAGRRQLKSAAMEVHPDPTENICEEGLTGGKGRMNGGKETNDAEETQHIAAQCSSTVHRLRIAIHREVTVPRETEDDAVLWGEGSVSFVEKA